MTLTVKRITVGNMRTGRDNSSGWYDFSGINQEHRYIKVNALNCGTDRKAINTARKIAGDNKAGVAIE